MKPQKPNYLANNIEKLTALNALPKPLIAHFQEQERLTDIVRTHLPPVLGEAAMLVRTVRHHNGQLILQVPTATLANHLRYLEGSLIDSLKTEPTFSNLTEIVVVVLDFG